MIFRNWVLENFPFLEDDFDALTDYELFCKMLEYVKTIVKNDEDFNKRLTDLENYINNLDLQDEVNNKLDEMAESGELTDIIAQYLQLAGVLAFNTLNDLVNATNIVNGSICRTLGESTYNDGRGSYYKIRTITSEDVVDGINIVALNISNTLIAERITNYINKKWLFIGDSYAQGYNPDGNVTGWPYLLKTKMNLSNDECIISATGGAGFANTSNKYEDIINNMTADNNITDVLICGGYNDLTYDENSIFNGMSNTLSKIREKFVNVKNIYIGFIGGCTNNLHGDIHVRISYYVTTCTTLGITYLPNLEYALFNAGYFGSDGIHPNEYGEISITRAIYNALNGGFTYNRFESIGIDTSESDYFGSVNFPLHLNSNNNISYLSSYSRIFLTASSDFEYTTDDNIKLGKITQVGIIGSKYINNRYSIGTVVVQSYSNPEGYYNALGKIYIGENGIVWLHLDMQANYEHNNYQNFGAIHQIQIPEFNIVYVTNSM